MRGEHGGDAWEDFGGPAGKVGGVFLLCNDLFSACIILFVTSMGLLKTNTAGIVGGGKCVVEPQWPDGELSICICTSRRSVLVGRSLLWPI